MKYNLSLLKNKEIEFDILHNGKSIRFRNFIKNTKQTKDTIVFIFENCYLETTIDTFSHMLVRRNERDNCLVLKEDKTKTFLSSFIGFTMFDTYGFPIEMTEEILSEKESLLDVEGFYILREIQKEISSNTFKNKNAF